MTSRSGTPRVISKATSNTWSVFTDACYELSDMHWPCGLGGVLLDSSGRSISFFSHCLSEHQMIALGSDKKKTIIFRRSFLQLFLPFVFGLSILMVPKLCFTWTTIQQIQQETLQYPPVVVRRCLLVAQPRLSLFPWYRRVPSPSTCAHCPSRNGNSILELFGVERSGVTGEVCFLMTHVA